MISSPYAHRTCELVNVSATLLDYGVRPGHLLKKVGLPAHALLEANSWIPRPFFLKLINSLAHMTGETNIVLHVAERDPIEKLGLFGQAILNAPTLRQALSIAGERTALVQTGVRIRLLEQESLARLSYEFIGPTGENPELYIQAVLAFLLKFLALTGAPIPVRVFFKSEKPRNSGELERAFGPNLNFRMAYDELLFDRVFLDLPLQQEGSDHLFNQEGRVTQQSEEQLVRSVRQTIADLIPRQTPTLELTANIHGLNKRTLERRLYRWGTTFEVLLDQLRRERGLKFVKQGHRSITDIAFHLGYSDPSHFIRAFRRWTGMAPKDFASAEISPDIPLLPPAA